MAGRITSAPEIQISPRVSGVVLGENFLSLLINWTLNQVYFRNLCEPQNLLSLKLYKSEQLRFEHFFGRILVSDTHPGN
tara:strand:+ start:113 stop:349 length:237 start_codon:yes stop_codon:yes gene_type:complete